jgi:hypothetical protein
MPLKPASRSSSFAAGHTSALRCCHPKVQDVGIPEDGQHWLLRYSMLKRRQAEPLEGGQLVAAGRMWISPQAEEDPRAVRMQAQGRGLPAEALLQRYLPPVRALLQQQPARAA